MGAWSFLLERLEATLEAVGAEHTRPRYVGRKASASTATGIASKHKEEQAALVEAALAN